MPDGDEVAASPMRRFMAAFCRRMALIAGLVVMAGTQSCVCVDRQDLLGDRLEGLFGVKFGESMPPNAVVIPICGSMFITNLKPMEPEFTFQEYNAMLNSETRAVIGFMCSDRFGDDELAKCNEAYERSKRAVKARLKKNMKEFPPVDTGAGTPLLTLRNCEVTLPGNEKVWLEIAKMKIGGYVLRFIAFDMNLAKGPLDRLRSLENTIPPLEGFLGRKFGELVPLSKEGKPMVNGRLFLAFEPEEKFLDFEYYEIHFLPKSRKTSAVVAMKKFTESSQANECFTRVCQYLEEMFGLMAMDVTSNYDTTKPNEKSGDQVVKVAGLVFPGSTRLIEVQCMKVVRENIFHVRVLASDNELEEGPLESVDR